MSSHTSPPTVWRNSKKFPSLIGRKGVITSFSKIYCGNTDIENRCPYYIAMVKLEDTEKNIMVEICRENDDMVKIGAEVKLACRKHTVSEKGLISYTIKGKICG